MIITRQFIKDCAGETIAGVEYEYRFTLVSKLTEWARENKARFTDEQGYFNMSGMNKFIDAIVDKCQDIAADENYPLVSELSH